MVLITHDTNAVIKQISGKSPGRNQKQFTHEAVIATRNTCLTEVTQKVVFKKNNTEGRKVVQTIRYRFFLSFVSTKIVILILIIKWTLREKLSIINYLIKNFKGHLQNHFK